MLQLSPALARTLKKWNRTVTVLNMTSNDIGLEGAKAWLVPGFSWRAMPLQSFAWHAMPLSRVFDGSLKLECVEFFWMAMPALISFGTLIFVAAVIQALAEALKVNDSVEVINMEDNDIGTEGAKAWARLGLQLLSCSAMLLPCV